MSHLGTDRAGHLCGKDADFGILPQSQWGVATARVDKTNAGDLGQTDRYRPLYPAHPAGYQLRCGGWRGPGRPGGGNAASLVRSAV